MKQDIHKVEEQVIDALVGLRAIRQLMAGITADSERRRLITCRDDIGTLSVNANALKVELGRVLPVLTNFLAEWPSQ